MVKIAAAREKSADAVTRMGFIQSLALLINFEFVFLAGLGPDQILYSLNCLRALPLILECLLWFQLYPWRLTDKGAQSCRTLPKLRPPVD